MKNEFQEDQRKQLETINRDINILQSNLTATKNFANDFKLIDQQMETVQQKQNELSRFGIGNEQKINAVWTNLTDNMHRLEEKLNFAQERQLELTSDLRDHDQQVKTVQQQQVKLISKDDLLDQRMNDSLTNITFNMKQIERRAFENITDLSSQMNSTTKKIGLLWINFLDGKNLIQPIIQKYKWNYAASLTTSPQNLTEAIHQEIKLLDLNETAEHKRILTDLISTNFLSVKLHPIDSNLKKVKYSFTVQLFERNNLYLVSGSFDGEA